MNIRIRSRGKRVDYTWRYGEDKKQPDLAIPDSYLDQSAPGIAVWRDNDGLHVACEHLVTKHSDMQGRDIRVTLLFFALTSEMDTRRIAVLMLKQWKDIQDLVSRCLMLTDDDITGWQFDFNHFQETILDLAKHLVIGNQPNDRHSEQRNNTGIGSRAWLAFTDALATQELPNDAGPLAVITGHPDFANTEVPPKSVWRLFYNGAHGTISPSSNDTRLPTILDLLRSDKIPRPSWFSQRGYQVTTFILVVAIFFVIAESAGDRRKKKAEFLRNVEEIQEEFAAIKSELISTTRDYEEFIKKLEQQNKQSGIRIPELQSEINKLKFQNHELTQENSRLKQEIKQLTNN